MKVDAGLKGSVQQTTSVQYPHELRRHEYGMADLHQKLDKLSNSFIPVAAQAAAIFNAGIYHYEGNEYDRNANLLGALAGPLRGIAGYFGVDLFPPTHDQQVVRLQTRFPEEYRELVRYHIIMGYPGDPYNLDGMQLTTAEVDDRDQRFADSLRKLRTETFESTVEYFPSVDPQLQERETLSLLRSVSVDPSRPTEGGGTKIGLESRRDEGAFNAEQVAADLLKKVSDGR